MYHLRAGAARCCINPTEDMYPIPNQMTDFGLEPMSQEEPYDDINCRAIAVSTGEVTMLFLTFELSGAPEFPHYPEDIAAATGVPADMIFIMGTHNHSAPRYRKNQDNSPELATFIEKYEKIVYKQGIAACRQAVASMRPARYGYGEAISDINVNRNLLTYGGCWVEAANRTGYSDKTLSVIKFTDMDGKLIAAFLNHPTHGTFTFRFLALGSAAESGAENR